ncbi:hypothetical protein JKP88DRAFT_354299 [Tribonema minus]|uniref:Uncharacterized protein n=1 Tax=Tribonema minus TaxID=303371 RepID=A0A836CGJ9_9STRA|nr:hypothetical protein JKP88DRAFT_354299 [Tribonema minus]
MTLGAQAAQAAAAAAAAAAADGLSAHGRDDAQAAQAAAGAVSGEEARREGAVAARAQLEEHAKALANMREQHDLALQQVIQEKDAEYHKATENHKKALNDVQLELLNNRQHMINTEAQWRRRLEDVEQRERAELARTKEHFEALLARAKGETAAALEGLGRALWKFGGDGQAIAAAREGQLLYSASWSHVGGAQYEAVTLSKPLPPRMLHLPLGGIASAAGLAASIALARDVPLTARTDAPHPSRACALTGPLVAPPVTLRGGSAVAAGAAAGALDGGYPSGSGLSREAGEGGGLQGGGGGGAGDVDKLRSLAMLLEESRKEARWLRDRNGESERVIEALRKTIMRQAELNSQRDSSTGGGGGGGGGGSGGINTNNGPLRGHHYAGPRGPPSRGPRPGPPDWQSERAPPHHHHRGDGSGGGGAPHRDAHYNSRSGGGGRGGGGGGPPHLRAPPPHHHGNYQDDGGGDPDRSWGARSAPLPLHDAPDRSRSAPLPEHQAAAAALQQYLAAVPAAAAQQPWDRAPLRDSAAFLTMPYPPGAAPPAFGPGALFKHVGGGGGGGGARGGDGGGYGGGAHAMHHALPTRSSSSPHLQAHAQLGGGGGGAMAAQGGGAMRMPQPRQPASMLSRPGSMSSLNHIHEDVHEYEPGAGELDTATSVLSGF